MIRVKNDEVYEISFQSTQQESLFLWDFFSINTTRKFMPKYYIIPVILIYSYTVKL